MTRTLFLSAIAVLLCAAPSTAQDADRLRKQVQELREQLAESKRTIAVLRAKVAKLEAGKAKTQKKTDAKKNPILRKRLTLKLDGTPLSQVARLIRERTGLNVVMTRDVPLTAVVTLDLKDITLRGLLDLIVMSSLTEDGDIPRLKWRLESKVITISK